MQLSNNEINALEAHLNANRNYSDQDVLEFVNKNLKLKSQSHVSHRVPVVVRLLQLKVSNKIISFEDHGFGIQFWSKGTLGEKWQANSDHTVAVKVRIL